MIRDDSDSYWKSWLPHPSTPPPRPSQHRCSETLRQFLLLLQGASYHQGDERCKWKQLSTWHPGSEFPPPPGGNRGAFLHLILSPPPPAKMCPHLMISVPVQTPTSSPHLPKWPLTSPKMPHPPVCAWNKGRSSHTHNSYPTVPPYSHPRVQVEKKHSTTAWRSSADDAKRALREAQARSASLKPIRPVEFAWFKTNKRPKRTESRTSKDLVSTGHI